MKWEAQPFSQTSAIEELVQAITSAGGGALWALADPAELAKGILDPDSKKVAPIP